MKEIFLEKTLINCLTVKQHFYPRVTIRGSEMYHPIAEKGKVKEKTVGVGSRKKVFLYTSCRFLGHCLALKKNRM